MNVNGLIIRVIVILLAILQPFIIMFWYGVDVVSISSMWETSLQPLFIITNATTSYFLFSVHRWLFPSLFLLLLTAFSVEYHMVTHNIFAGLFFISCINSLFGYNRLRWYLFPYLLSGVVWLMFGMFWGEVFAVLVICIYHANLLYVSYDLKNRKRGG